MNYKRYLIVLLCVGFLFVFGCSGLMKAEFKLSQQKYDEAIPLYKEYLAQKPDSTDARSKLGFTYLKAGQMDNAIEEFEKVLKQKPGEPYSILYLGMAYLNKKEFGKAMAIWQQFRNKKQPLVEEEIQRLLTLLQIAENHNAAKTMLEDEKNLKTLKPEPNTVAVSYYQDLSPDKSLRAFQKALAAMVITELSKVKHFKVVERLRIQALLQEMKLGQTGILDPRSAPRVGRLLGVENIVVGTLTLGSIQATTSMSSTVKGGVTGSASAKVEKENFFDLPGIITHNIAEIAGVELTSDEVKAIGIPQTTVYDAFINYGKGLDALDAGRWQDARNFFAKAVELDPKFDMAREAQDSSPSPSAPSIGQITSMAPASLAATVSAAVNNATKAQDAADEAAAEAAAADSGGGGGGGGGGSCFSPDTKVLMADNSLKRIIDIQVGDKVKAFDVANGEKVIANVTDTYNGEIDAYYLINGELRVSPPHPFFTTKGRWTKIADLEVGDKIKNFNGVTGITSIEKIQSAQRHYNISVESFHNFFVSTNGRNFYLVNEGN